MKKTLIFVLCLSCFILGCGDSEASKKNEKSSNTSTEVKGDLKENKSITDKNVDYDQLRKKAEVAEAASLVGYDGKDIKKKLNKVIDDREKMDKQLKDASSF